MDVSVVYNRHPALAAIIDYFLFFQKADGHPLVYQTFPNTNICLAIYKHNRIQRHIDAKTNSCLIQSDGAYYSSCLWGFHHRPFQVQAEGPVEQICINLKAGALRYFTAKPYTELILTQNVWEELFGSNASYLLEQVFETASPLRRAALLESFFYKRLQTSYTDQAIQWSLQYIGHKNGDVRVDELATRLNINTSTLFRRFRSAVGQSPKEYIKTVRFRAALSDVLKDKDNKLVEVGYQHAYYDQAHFIKDFTQLAGASPKAIKNGVVVLSSQFVWKKATY